MDEQHLVWNVHAIMIFILRNSEAKIISLLFCVIMYFLVLLLLHVYFIFYTD